VRLAAEREDLSIRIIDIGDWDSPVAEQYGIHSLPTLWLYEEGVLVENDLRGVLSRLQE